jgi:hypothetical protein
MPSQLFWIALALALASCAGQQVTGRMSIAIPQQFKNTVKEELIQPTHPDPSEGPARTFIQPTRIVSGRWLDPVFVSYTRSGTYYGNTKYRTWSIEVTKGADRDVVKALEIMMRLRQPKSGQLTLLHVSFRESNGKNFRGEKRLHFLHSIKTTTPTMFRITECWNTRYTE